MEFVLIYLFVMVEKLAAFLDKGYALLFWSLIALAVGVLVALLSVVEDPQLTVADRIKQPLFKKPLGLLKFSAVVGLCMGVLSSCLPSQKELAIIVGSGVTYNVLTSDKAKQVGGKALQLLEQKIDNALESEEPMKKIVPVAK